MAQAVKLKIHLHIYSSFESRPWGTGGLGEFNLSKYFSGETISPFYGISYILNPKTVLN